MSRDPLERATRALKEETEAAPADVRRLRARVLATVQSEQRRRSKRWVYVLPIAAVLAATTAFAARSGKLVAVTRYATELVGLADDEGLPPASPRATPTATPAASAPAAMAPASGPAPSGGPATPDVVPVAPPAEAASTRPGRASRAPVPAPSGGRAPTVTPAMSPAAPAPDTTEADGAELASYRRAHALHFVEQDCARAVPAWDAYLAGAPSGAFVAEARYNRGICLARLGRRAEARAALRPFADGAVAGGYRQRESRALLDALDADANAD